MSSAKVALMGLHVGAKIASGFFAGSDVLITGN
jgi:hypothetical protein